MANPQALQSLVDAFSAEMDEIESIYHQCRNHALVAASMPYLPSEEGCLFALWDAWSRFLRGLVMAASAGPVVGISGATYSPSRPLVEKDVLAVLRRNQRGQSYKITNQEPNWHDERAIADIVSVLRLPNGGIVVGAVTATAVGLGPVQVPSPLNEIRKARNYSAHKNWKTRADIAAFDSTFSTLSAHLRKKRRGVETFLEWAEALEALGSAAAW